MGKTITVIKNIEKKMGFQTELKWKNIIFISGFHVFGIYWSYLFAFPVKWQTILFDVLDVSVVLEITLSPPPTISTTKDQQKSTPRSTTNHHLHNYAPPPLTCLSSLCRRRIFIIFHVLVFLTYMFAGIGIVCGAHRLWAHRSFKATLPLRIYLMLGFACSGQNAIYDWVHTHRLHHKYSDTDADPHNSNRGFFYSHIGWLLMKKNDIIRQKERLIDMSDIENDAVAAFHRKHVVILNAICCFILPTATGIVMWNENWKCAIAWNCFIRYLTLMHFQMTINSVSHMFGSRPYRKDIKPTSNSWVALCTCGEGNHNYHHTFPCDYKSGETMDLFNSCSLLIRIWASLGLAYDLKETSPKLIQAVLKNQNTKHTHCVKDR